MMTTSDPTTPALLTVSAAARDLGKSEKWVRLQESRGLLPAVRASNGTRLFRREDVAEYRRTLDAA